MANLTRSDFDKYDMGGLLDLSQNECLSTDQRQVAANMILERLPTWKGDVLGLDPSQRRRLRALVKVGATV